MTVRLVVLTGAGVSADSGVATFRGGGGLWEGHRVEDVATPEAWVRDPKLVWRFYQMRRAALLEVEPNAAHLALARFEQRMEEAGNELTLVSQNVDDLHQRAGSRVISMHGSLTRLVCEVCSTSKQGLDDLDGERYVPCKACGNARMRPDIVWFGEMPMEMDSIELALSRCTHFLSLGTSGVVYPAAGFLHAARSVGAETFVASLDEPENLDPRDEFLPGRAVDVVPALLERWAGEWGLRTPG